MTVMVEMTKQKQQDHQREKKILALLIKEQGLDKLPDLDILAVIEDSKMEHLSVVDAAIAYIFKNYHKPISLLMVAEEIGVSVSYLSGLFHRKMGEPYVKFLTRIRMEAAARYLDNCPGMLVSEIAEKTGYMTTKHFLYVFKKHFGQTPTEYRQLKKT
jgi:YesN/AraC family two-component response regulator